MPAYDKVSQLIEKLFQGTEQRALEWQATADENSFRLASKSANIKISREEVFDRDAEQSLIFRNLSIMNDKGRVIEEYFPEHNSINEPRFDELFAMARRSAYKTEEVIETLMHEIDAKMKL